MRSRTIVRGLEVARSLISDTVGGYWRDRGDLMAAALAFYALLSIAPLVLIAAGVGGLVLGTDTARAEITKVLGQRLGGDAAAMVDVWVDAWVEESARSGTYASAIGVFLVVFTASRLVAQLRNALNQVWNFDPATSDGFESSFKDHGRRRLFGFVFVVAAAPALLAVFASRALLSGLHDTFSRFSPVASTIIQLLQVTFSLAVVIGVTGALFRIVPDVRMHWNSIWIGAVLASLLLNVGNLFVGTYVGRATASGTQGAAGSLFVILLWINLSFRVFLLCAEFTQVHSKRAKRPSPPAVKRLRR